MGLLDRMDAARTGSTVATRDETRFGIDPWITDFLIPSSVNFMGQSYLLGLNQTLAGNRAAEIVHSLPSYMAALHSCPPAFAAQMVRALVLSQARFTFRNPPWHPRNPRRTFGTGALGALERPWPNATTGELLARMEWHAGLAGNAYVANRGGRLRVLRPDWTAIIYGSDSEPDNPGHALDGKLLGYLYVNGGFNGPWGYDASFLLPDEVAHWSPIPDPLNAGIGMAWLTPALREIKGDQAASDFKIKLYEQGAPQPLDAAVLTPAGWTTMGDVEIGDQVIGSDGKGRDVVAVYPQGERDIYRVTFSTGAQVECTDDHLWTVASVNDRVRGVTRTVPLRDIIESGVTYASGPAKWSVPLVEPIEYDDFGLLPLDPYLLGSLLGDGWIGHKTVSLAAHTADVGEQMDLLGPVLPADVTMTRRDRGGSSSEVAFQRVVGGPRKNSLTSALTDLGLAGKRSHEKSIPETYLRAGVIDRVSLLQGLIDTDGSVSRGQGNQVRFSTTSRALADGLADLAGGLGAFASVRPARGEKPGQRAQWRVNISRLPEWIIPCRLARKRALYRPTFRGGRWRYIQKIEFVGRKQAQCIGVDSADHLYVTDGYVLTHNTPNLVVKGIPATTKEKFDEMVSMMEEKHAGIANAFKTLYLTAGVDATVVGSNMKDLDFKAITASGETRISVLSRVPASLLGISEGLTGSSLNAGNFSAARRSFADTWVYPSLQDVCAALAPLVNVPDDAELWFDVQDIPLLREDAKDAAEIAQLKVQGIRTLVDGGFTPQTAVAAVAPEWSSVLTHTNLVSVQLLPPGTTAAPAEPKAQNGATPPKPAAPKEKPK